MTKRRALQRKGENVVAYVLYYMWKGRSIILIYVWSQPIFVWDPISLWHHICTLTTPISGLRLDFIFLILVCCQNDHEWFCLAGMPRKMSWIWLENS